MLATLGFNVLAIDQRSGGNAWGRTNETVKRLGKSTGYDEALPDLEAALQWAKSSGETGPIIVWGSSYSAALVFLLAANHRREVKAILAFSPGEYLRGSIDRPKSRGTGFDTHLSQGSKRDCSGKIHSRRLALGRQNAIHPADRGGCMDLQRYEKTRTPMASKKIGRRSNTFSRNSHPSRSRS
jgi:pimeloyl-ACP methyl ester carboxylesterase